MSVIPIFKSHFSIGKSVLTLEERDAEHDDNHPDSIIDIAVDNGLDTVYLVEDSMAGFLQAYTNCKKENISLRFGIRLTVCNDIATKDESSFLNEHKVTIWLKNSEGYQNIISIYTKAATDGFYYEPRIDFKTLKELWTDNLTLTIPFYDSFLMKNSLTFSNIVTDFSFTKPMFFVEKLHNLPFDNKIIEAVEIYAKTNEYSVEQTHSIYYKNRVDFKAFQTVKAMHNRSTLSAPNYDHLSDDTFCWEMIKNDK